MLMIHNREALLLQYHSCQSLCPLLVSDRVVSGPIALTIELSVLDYLGVLVDRLLFNPFVPNAP